MENNKNQLIFLFFIELANLCCVLKLVILRSRSICNVFDNLCCPFLETEILYDLIYPYVTLYVCMSAYHKLWYFSMYVGLSNMMLIF